jgi:phosphate transport system permease protein
MHMTLGTTPATELFRDDIPRPLNIARTRADRIYRALALSAGGMAFLIMGLIGLFLLLRAGPALRTAGVHFLFEREWRPDTPQPVFGILAVMFGTVVIAVIALTLAVPLSVATALFLTEYAPRRLKRPLGSMVDLLAAVPSLIYGLWGLFFLQPRLLGVSRWLGTYFAFIPIFKTKNFTFLSSSPFIVGVVVALMIVPICTSVMREVFDQTPPGEKEGALALGASRWGMIRTVVLPFGRGGIIGGSMLGLGRALGETIAVAIIISPVFTTSFRVLETGGNSVASLIALRFGESKAMGLSALMAAGLALFIVTLVVNMAATFVVSRSRSGAGVEI